MGRLFGTDGVRGIANTKLTPELAFKLGRAGTFLLKRCFPAHSEIVVGKDTRASGDLLESAVMAGILSTGCNGVALGAITTPGVAKAVKASGALGGVMISASHNPPEYNGIKFFDKDGFKLSDEFEDRIEAIVLSAVDELPRPIKGDVGRVRSGKDLEASYRSFLTHSAWKDISGMKTVLDCANGSASDIAPLVFAQLGAKVHTINASPNGCNINVECGSTSPFALVQEVLSQGADLGIAYDGDADRTIAVDEKGHIVDGDQIMAVCGLHMLQNGMLSKNTVVATVMSNIGLDIALRNAGATVIRTGVGDRYVIEEMMRSGSNLGGEQSGHIVFSDYSTTGDGILTSIQLACCMAEARLPLSKLAAQMQKLPQVLESVRVPKKELFSSSERIQQAITGAQLYLGESGRVLVRPSGTEPLIRVMAEADDQEKAREVVRGLIEVIQQELG